MPTPDLLALAELARDRIVALAQGLVQTPSLTGKEGKAAALVEGAMRGLHYDEVRVDEVGNVLGRLAGGGGRSVLLHAHLDIVDPGDPGPWRFPPYAGKVAEGFLWGRGASETEASLASQVMAVGLLREAGIMPPGDVHVAAVVGEEIGGYGTRHMLQGWRPDVAVIGEPSGNTLRRGHRGRFEFLVTFHGRSAHASAPGRGLNPHHSMARFVLALRQAPMARDAVFGDTTVTPTLAYVDQTSSNVIPAALTVHLDWRNAPAETPEEAQALLERLAGESAEEGYTARGALADVDGPRLHRARATHHLCHAGLPAGRGRARVDYGTTRCHRGPRPSGEVGLWTFATDGGRLNAAGVRASALARARRRWPTWWMSGCPSTRWWRPRPRTWRWR